MQRFPQCVLAVLAVLAGAGFAWLDVRAPHNIVTSNQAGSVDREKHQRAIGVSSSTQTQGTALMRRLKELEGRVSKLEKSNQDYAEDLSGTVFRLNALALELEDAVPSPTVEDVVGEDSVFEIDTAGLAEQQFSKGREEHANAIREPAWAEATEASLRADIQKEKLLQTAELRSLDCRAESCEVVVELSNDAPGHSVPVLVGTIGRHLRHAVVSHEGNLLTVVAVGEQELL